MWEVQATAAPGVNATQTEPQTAEEHVDAIQAPDASRRGAGDLWLLVDGVGGDDEDVVGAHVGLCGAGTGVDAGDLAPADRRGAVTVGCLGRRRVVATPDGTAVTACVAEAGEVVLQDEAGDEAREAIQADVAVVVVDAAALRGEDVIVPVGRATLGRQPMHQEVIIRAYKNHHGHETEPGRRIRGRRLGSEIRGRHTASRSGFRNQHQMLYEHVSTMARLRGRAGPGSSHSAQPSRPAVV